MTRVLMVAEPDGGNSYVDTLARRLQPHVELTLSVREFWQPAAASDAQIVHIQWPEALFGWRTVRAAEVEALSDKLDFWIGRGARILITRHNDKPHRLNDAYAGVYQAIYSRADAIVHLSQASVADFAARNPAEREMTLRQEVILHHLYEDTPNEVSREDARHSLAMAGDSEVVLVFGNVRHRQERDFTKRVFERIRVENKLLVSPGWYRTARPSVKRHPLRRVRFHLSKLLEDQKKDRVLDGIFVPEERVQLYMNAADVVLIPRFDVLNSGIAPLAFSFNKLVVGPALGGIGELLALAGCPSFRVGDVAEAAEKLEAGLLLSRQRVRTRERADEFMSCDLIARQHHRLYDELAEP